MVITNSSEKDLSVNTSEFLWQVRVYYEDTDVAGVVYHSNYLKYMERARTEWLRSAGYAQPSLEKKSSVIFMVSSLNIEFIVPARFDELLNVQSIILTIGGAKLLFRQTIFNENGILNCKADFHIVCVDPYTFKPKRIPEDIRTKLTNDS